MISHETRSLITNSRIFYFSGVTPMSLIEQSQTLSRIVAKCRVDSDFKSSLLQDPTSVLRDGGVHVPDGLSIEFIPSGQEVPASTESVTYVSVDVLDRDPVLLTEEALTHVSGGATTAGNSTALSAGGAFAAPLSLLGQSTVNCSCDMCYRAR